MADIELVVKIDAERYEAIKKHNGIPTVSDGVDAADAILNGTPLPKGHGDLIDRKELLADSYPIDDYAGNEVNIIDVMTVKMADTIIEAERA